MGIGEGAETVIDTYLDGGSWILAQSLIRGHSAARASFWAQAAGPIMMMTHMCVALSIWRGGVCAHGDQRTD